MNATFTAGQTVYTQHGNKAKYITAADQKHVIQYYATSEDDEDGEEFLDRVVIVSDVYANPPVQVRDATVAELDAKIYALKQQLRGFETDIRQKQAEMKGLMERLSSVPALRNLEAFIEGKMTHFVVKRFSSIEILTKDQALDDNDCYDKGVKLLSLFGTSKGNMSWKLNQYKDGSGTWTEVYPATSLEDAKAQAADLLNEAWEEVRSGSTAYLTTHVKSAAEIGLPIPDDIAAMVKKVRSDAANAVIARLEGEMRKTREAFADVLPAA